MCDNCECENRDNPIPCKQNLCYGMIECEDCQHYDPCECDCHTDWEAVHYEHKSDTERGV